MNDKHGGNDGNDGRLRALMYAGGVFCSNGAFGGALESQPNVQ